MTANEKVYDEAVDRAAMLRNYEKTVQDKVFLTLDGHEVRVDKLLRGAKLSTKGFNQLRDAIDEELLRTHKTLFQTTKRSLLDLAHDQVSYTFQSFETAVSRIWRSRKPSRAIGEEIVLKRPLAGDRALEPAWHNVRLSEKKRLEQVIRKGIAAGSAPEQIALDVRKGNVHKITRNHSKALVTTAITSVTAQADHSVYEANRGALQGWQYIAILDSNTTPICRHRDANVYEVGDYRHLPPAHFHCRSTTVPVVKNWGDIGALENVAQVRKRNISKLTPAQRAYYDGVVPVAGTYDDWLRKQPLETQLRHLGSAESVDLYNKGQLDLKSFSREGGEPIGIKGLRQLTDSEYTAPNDTIKFANAKRKLDALHLGISRPDDLVGDIALQNRLREYYKLQAGELDGVLSITNYRGNLLGNKRRTKRSVLTKPPTEDQLKYNPITGRYEDVRLYQPNLDVYNNQLRLLRESEELTSSDKDFIEKFSDSLEEQMGVNQRAVILDNLRIVFTRYRKEPEPWANFKAVLQGQIKFDVMNISDTIETQVRKDSDVLKKLTQDNYIDPVLGATQLEELGSEFLSNIKKKNKWEDAVAPKIAKELKPLLNTEIPVELKLLISDEDLELFYTKFAYRLALADSPDKDQLAVSLGRDIYNLAGLSGTRNQWFNVGDKLLSSKRVSDFYELETFGVQKRRMKSRMSGQYFGPYYDTFSQNLRIVDPRIQEYSKLTRKVDIGLRVSVKDDANRLLFREGYKTYFVKNKLGIYEDTRIPVTSTGSFSDFPEDFMDKNMVDALTHASKSRYRVDDDFYDFINKLLYFEDDRGKAKHYNGLNEYKKFMASRGDAYERLKAMEWLRKDGSSFSNHPFIDHRARIYDRGLIGPQSGETFRPFLNTEKEYNFSKANFYNFQDQIGAFLGGLDERFEGRYNSLTVSGRQKIAEKYRSEMVEIGNRMRRRKPNDLRWILENDTVQHIEAEELGKFFRLSIELSKIDDFLKEQVQRLPTKGELFHVSFTPLANKTLKPRVPKNFFTREGVEDAKTPRVSFAPTLQQALQGLSTNLKGKKLYVYRAPAATSYRKITAKEVPDAGITDEVWVTEPVKVEAMGEVRVTGYRGKEKNHTLEFPFEHEGKKFTTIPSTEWEWNEVVKEPYSLENLETLNSFRTALALEQDASSSGAQIIALTTRNKQLAELSNVVPTNQKRRLYGLVKSRELLGRL